MPGTPYDNLRSIVSTTADALGFGDSLPASATGPGSSIIIEEQNLANPRRITLRGRAMPYRGVPWGGSQETKRTYYAGNPVATLQVLGPRENDTEMEGMWKDRFLRGAVVVTSLSGLGSGGGEVGQFDLAEDVVQLFHSIRRAGTLLRVQWLSETRFGVIKEFEADYDRAQDVRWTMSFEWIAWDDDQSLRSAEEPIPSSALLDGFDILMNAIALAPDVARATQAVLVGTVRMIGDSVASLFALLETIDSTLDTPGAVMGAIQNELQSLDRQLTELVQRVLDVKWPRTESATAISGPTTSPWSSRQTRSSVAKQELEFERWRKTVGRAGSNLRRASGDAVNARLERINPRTTRVVTVSQGTTLYDLSRRFYGTPDFASYLAQVNRLPGAQVLPGTPVRVPPRPGTAVSRDGVMSGGKPKGCEGC